jgi:hypothetical protein
VKRQFTELDALRLLYATLAVGSFGLLEFLQWVRAK